MNLKDFTLNELQEFLFCYKLAQQEFPVVRNNDLFIPGETLNFAVSLYQELSPDVRILLERFNPTFYHGVALGLLIATKCHLMEKARESQFNNPCSIQRSNELHDDKYRRPRESFRNSD